MNKAENSFTDRLPLFSPTVSSYYHAVLLRHNSEQKGQRNAKFCVAVEELLSQTNLRQETMNAQYSANTSEM